MYMYIVLYIYIYVCVCVCVCVYNTEKKIMYILQLKKCDFW